MAPLQIEHLAIGSLKPWARNARTHSKKQIRQIADSIRMFGFTNPVLIDNANSILAGHDNAVAESFFNLLKRERIRRKVYRSRDEARQDVFDYIEMFYNPKRKHVRNGMLSPVEFERLQKT